MTRRPEPQRGTKIAGTGMYVPDRVLTNRDLERMVDTSDEWILERTGVRERRIAAPDQASSDMALIAAQRALESAGVTPEEIDHIVLATTTPDHYLPSCACTVQARLGAHRAAAYDLFAACTGFIYGLSIGHGIIGTGQADTVLVIGVEMLSRVTDYKDRNTCVLFGDGAGAAVLRPCPPGEGMLAIRIQSDGRLGEMLEIPAGGSRLPASHATVDACGHVIKMRGKELFKVAVRAMEESLRGVLEESGLAPDDLDVVIPHQANLRIIDAMRERLGIPAEKVIVNIDRYGNTSSASIPISLDEVARGGRLKRGDHVGLVGFGGGVTWGAALVEWTEPARVRPVPPATAAAAHGAAS
jgi:3-oxoacyl-[acyl-carrier-protein] synthase-3